MTKEILVVNSKGLHARPATVFAETASRHDGDVKISYGGKAVNGKSLIALMSLAVPRDGKVTVSVEGPAADSILSEFASVLGKNYD
ncbi:MAG: HPr family phosphocarrier protein [Spirochaetales bacterium]|nr:HPr family phosphocarrier protein [Spirochaetales bacterium]